MFINFSVGKAFILMENHKNIFAGMIILGLLLSITGCGMLGTKAKTEAPPTQPTPPLLLPTRGAFYSFGSPCSIRSQRSATTSNSRSATS